MKKNNENGDQYWQTIFWWNFSTMSRTILIQSRKQNWMTIIEEFWFFFKFWLFFFSFKVPLESGRQSSTDAPRNIDGGQDDRWNPTSICFSLKQFKNSLPPPHPLERQPKNAPSSSHENQNTALQGLTGRSRSQVTEFFCFFFNFSASSSFFVLHFNGAAFTFCFSCPSFPPLDWLRTVFCLFVYGDWLFGVCFDWRRLPWQRRLASDRSLPPKAIESFPFC